MAPVTAPAAREPGTARQQEREPVSPACYTALEALYSYSKTGCEPTAAAAPSGCVRQCAPQQQNSRTKYVRGAVPLSPCQSLSTAGVQLAAHLSCKWYPASSFLQAGLAAAEAAGRAGAVDHAGEVLLPLELRGVTPPQEGRQWTSLATAGTPPVTRAMVVSWYMLCVVILGGSGQPRLRRQPGWCADGLALACWETAADG
ncbi:hypothetical protein OEZ85_005415 [Tetradesmus obliquus]|uniref:Uncharacterized protein n=1 Tax=Tetradesmus obliquus TaxID=3088 RepID=A0ABY8UHV5_TETOB|nr:hypothetical protein OEZ85_005415 [Tetradesmus obliquus]